MYNLKPIDEQVVVIMGASSGIGRGTALEFARRGASVVASARNEDDLRSLEREALADGGSLIIAPADTSDFGQVQAVADAAMSRYGRIDTWVQVAGVSVYAPFDQTTPDEFRQVVEVNLIGHAFGAMAALPHLRMGGGAFIGVSSVEARRPLPLNAAYGASKHGVAGMLDVLRMELKHDDVPVSVTNIMPASINTPLFNKARTRLGVKPMPVAPVYEPDAVAQAILYAAEHPREEIVVGGAGKLVTTLQRLSPRLLDAVFARSGYEMQKTNEPKGDHDGDALFGPMPGQGRVRGDFTDEAREHSYYTWMTTHPAPAAALATAAVGAGAVVATRLRHHNGHHEGDGHEHG
jgi:NAD(P)-dependent dehydrogenase (short-subunit alcohol dehydrogenase family)